MFVTPNQTDNSLNNLPFGLLILLGSTPLFMAAAPLAFTPEPEGWQIFLRTHSFIVLPIELAAIFYLMRSGGSVLHGWKALPFQSQCAILALTFISIIVSFQPGKDHLAAAIGLTRMAMAVMLALALLGRDAFGERDWRSLWLALALGAMFYFALFVAYVTTNTLEIDRWIGPFPGFNNIRHVAFLGFIAFSGGLAYLMFAERTSSAGMDPILVTAIGTVALTLVLWTGSRGPLLAITIATLGSLALFWENRSAILIYVAISFSAGIVIASLLPIPNPIYGVLQGFGVADVDSADLNTASSGRLEMWQFTLDEAMKRPFFGWGINQYAHYLPDSRPRFFHPHNYPLQLLFASGFVGAFLVIVAAASLIWQRKNFVRSKAQKFNAVIVATLLFYSLYDGILYFSYPMMIFVLVFIGCLQPPPATVRSD